MNEWYVLIENEQMGPFAETQVNELIESGEISGETLVWKEGLENWVQAASLQYYKPGYNIPPTSSPPRAKDNRPSWKIIWEELFISSEEWQQFIVSNPLFWIFILVVGSPLLILLIESPRQQLLCLSIFYAIIWGGVLKVSVLKEKKMWKTSLSSMAFTGLVGIVILFIIYELQSDFWSPLNAMTSSPNALLRLVGFLFLAASEELIKILPAFFFFRVSRKSFRLSQVLLIGMFSGLGFAAAENIIYSMGWIEEGAIIAEVWGGENIYNSMPVYFVFQMLRATTLCFLHATWTGIATAYSFGASTSARFDGRRFFLGVTLSTLLHAFYNWGSGFSYFISFIFTVATTGFFLVYYTRYRLQYIQAHN